MCTVSHGSQVLSRKGNKQFQFLQTYLVFLFCVLDGSVWDVTAADSCQASPSEAFIAHYCHFYVISYLQVQKQWHQSIIYIPTAYTVNHQVYNIYKSTIHIFLFTITLNGPAKLWGPDPEHAENLRWHKTWTGMASADGTGRVVSLQSVGLDTCLDSWSQGWSVFVSWASSAVWSSMVQDMSYIRLCHAVVGKLVTWPVNNSFKFN